MGIDIIMLRAYCMHMQSDNPILSARMELGLTPSRLAAKLGVNQSTVWRWEHGQLAVPQMALLAVEKLIAEQRENQGAGA